MRQLRIIYFALIASTFIYAGIVWVLVGSRAPMGTLEQEFRNPRILPFMLLSLATFTVSFSLTRLPWITRWSIVEVIAIYGLIATFLSNDWRLFAIGWVLSLVGFVIAFPREQ